MHLCGTTRGIFGFRSEHPHFGHAHRASPFYRPMMHPGTALRWIGAERGFGVVATEHLPKGTILYVLDPLDVVVQPVVPRTATRHTSVPWRPMPTSGPTAAVWCAGTTGAS